MGKTAFNNEKTFFHRITLTFKEKTSKQLHLEHNWKLDSWESRSEMLGKFCNVVLEKDGQIVPETKSVTKSHEGQKWNTPQKIKRKKAD